MYFKKAAAPWPGYPLLALVLSLLLPGLSGCGDTTASENAPAITRSSQSLADSTCITLQRGFGGDVADTQLSSHQVGHTAGSESELYVGQVGRHTRHGLLRFDTASIPPHATITSASLTLWRQGPSHSATLRAHAITAPWQEASITWEGFSAAFAPQVAATLSVGSRPASVSMSLTELVATWVRFPSLNHGLLLQQPEGHSLLASSESSNTSRRPSLRVCYFLPDSSPATSSAPSLLLQVLGDSGQPLTGASVSSGTSESSTDSAGYVVLDNLPVGFFSARIRAVGFAPAVVSLHLTSGARASHQVRLQPLGPPQSFVASEGASLERGPVRVSIPPHSIVDADGLPVSGTVEATVVPLDPASTPTSALPGPLEGLPAGDSEQPVPLESFLMAEVSLWQEGRPLQLAPGATATLELLLPESAAARFSPGDSIPAWWLDLDRGLWVREGTGTIQQSSAHPGRLSWVVAVQHFTWWNCDAPLYDRSCVDVRVRYSNGLPAAHVQVGASGASYNGLSRTAFTNAEGRACVEIKRGGTARVFGGLADQSTTEATVTGTAQATACGGTACTPVELFFPPPVCTPGDVQSCAYSGPQGTENVGLCRAAHRYCNATNSAWGECEGAVLPALETCLNTFDEDCDGQTDEGCGCGMPCYTGPSGTLGVGVCQAGTTACQMGRAPWCQGQTRPAPDICSTSEDDDCNGIVICTAPINRFWRAGNAACEQTVFFERSGDSLFVTGSFSGTLDLGNGIVLDTTSEAHFVARLDANTLAPVWARKFEVPSGTNLDSKLEVDNRGHLLVRGRGNKPFLARFEGASGELLWLTQLGSLNGYASFQSQERDASGNILLMGSFFGDLTSGGTTTSGSGPFLARIDGASGALLWLTPLQLNGDFIHKSTEKDASGNLLLTFYRSNRQLFAKLDGTTGAPLWLHYLGSYDAGIFIHRAEWNARGDLLLTGEFWSTLTLGDTTLSNPKTPGPNFGPQQFAAKLGESSWLVHLDSAEGASITSVAMDASSNLLLTGMFKGELTLGDTHLSSPDRYSNITAKFQSHSGALLWLSRLESTYVHGLQQHSSIIDPSGDNLEWGSFSGDLLLGDTPLPNSSGQDFFVARRDGASGSLRWSAHFQSLHGNVTSVKAERDAAGNILVLGAFTDRLTVGGTTLTVPNSIFNYNRFVAKLDGATGALLWLSHIKADFFHIFDSPHRWDASGNLLLTGQFSGELTIGDLTTSGWGLFFAKLDGTSGAPLWLSHIKVDSMGGPLGQSLEWDANDNVLLSGRLSGRLIHGSTTISGPGVYAAKLNGTSGAALWVSAINSPKGDFNVESQKWDASGNLLLTGQFRGNLAHGSTTTTLSNPSIKYDLFAARLGATSNWLFHLDSNENFTTRYQHVWDASGNLLLTGPFNGNLTLGGITLSRGSSSWYFDYFVAKIRSETGAPAWVQRLEGSQFSPNSIKMEPTGEVFILGALSGTLQVEGAPPVTSAGCFDVFLGKIPSSY
ncbi:DNRLRE domain-containing protein [Archangium sp.]|uniref:DNRLRE domain-containing protein n=1 Tax=Archangium sp. TaxID=1872627 RepID=UPI00286BA53C|nr:DNRLRE domain-containing protein [Archangium sp.]